MKTENNSNEMKTQVQTYIIEETQELIYDGEKLETWTELTKSLGLSGQQGVQVEKKSPIPFMCLNQVQENILKTLCPKREDVKEYGQTPIPLPILDLIGLSVKEKYFNKIEVWYDDRQKDPAVVGVTGEWRGDDADGKSYDRGFDTLEELEEYRREHGGEGKWKWFRTNQKYLLGRWADVKEDFTELAKRARERFITEQGVEQKRIIRDAERKIEDLETEAFNQFGV